PAASEREGSPGRIQGEGPTDLAASGERQAGVPSACSSTPPDPSPQIGDLHTALVLAAHSSFHRAGAPADGVPGLRLAVLGPGRGKEVVVLDDAADVVSVGATPLH